MHNNFSTFNEAMQTLTFILSIYSDLQIFILSYRSRVLIPSHEIIRAIASSTLHPVQASKPKAKTLQTLRAFHVGEEAISAPQADRLLSPITH